MSHIKYRTSGVVFLALFSLATIILFRFNVNFDIESIGILSKLFFFDKFFLEYIVTTVLFILFMNQCKVSQFIAFMVFLLFVSIWTSQIVTFLISGDFLSLLALENVEFIGFLLTFENVMILLSSLLALILLPYVLTSYILKHNFMTKLWKYIALFFILITLLILLVRNTDVADTILEDKQKIFSKNYTEDVAPIEALVNLFIFEKKVSKSLNYAEVKTLKELGIQVNPKSEYPLKKDWIYDENIKFDVSVEKPNIIVIFTEGLSARTTSMYSDVFKDITPNLKDFSEHSKSMRVDNYYNHTAATYRGLHGQLCSLYPFLGGGKYWFDNDVLELASVRYKCLPHILQNNAYETSYLNMHYDNQSANAAMVSHFGFDFIYSAEELSEKYLLGIEKIRSSYLSDHQSYDVLINYLKAKKTTTRKPFFLATYTVETHAYVDIKYDGIAYKDGKDNVLNTIHSMDDAFGKFWKYFKNSKYAKNTMIVFTSDHAHFNGKEYMHTLKKNGTGLYHPVFIDKVPLLIYAPQVKQDGAFDAKQSTSVDLAPTILNLADIKNESNAFVGKSIFTKNKKNVGIASFGRHLFFIKKDYLLYKKSTVLKSDKYTFETIEKFMKFTQDLEKTNRIYAE